MESKSIFFLSALTDLIFCLRDGECRSSLPRRGYPPSRLGGGWMKRGSLVPAFWSFFYLHDSNGAQIGSDARKKLQADDDVVQLAFCKFSSDGSNCKEPPIPPATANLRRQQSASAATRGAVAQRFSEAAPPKTNRRRVSFLAARGRYVEEVGARAAK